MRLVPLTTTSPASARALALVAAAALVVLAAVSANELGRAAALATALTGVAVALLVLRRRRAQAVASPLLVVTERLTLGRDVGLALVAAGRRRLVVGYGSAGVTVVAELAPAADATREEARP